MSRWLTSVNKILDTLDTNVGEAVDGSDEALYDDVVEGVEGESSVDDILAKRGLLNNEEEDDEDDEDEEEKGQEMEEGDSNNSTSKGVETSGEEKGLESSNSMTESSVNSNVSQKSDDDEEEEDRATSKDDETEDERSGVDVDSTNISSGSGDEIENAQESSEIEIEEETSKEVDEPVETLTEETTSKEEEKEPNEQKIENGTEICPAHVSSRLAELEAALANQKEVTKRLEKESNAANKEARKLRRNVVKLNADLDVAERELDAQRTELERAAVRIEKDRERYKEDKERMEREHKEEMKNKTNEHKAAAKSVAAAHAEQLSDMEGRIQRAEEARAKEGGDMSMELADSATRERETLKKVLALEEERSTLVSQVSSLETQMEGLQSRLDSVQQTAESASTRERESDDRLDDALSLHARQMSLRQAREGELERTIADLGAALVASRQRENQLKAVNNNDKMESNNSDLVMMKEKLESMENECEMLQAQVVLEKQRSETLQQELQDESQERMLETSAALSREKEYDNRVAELTAKVSQLQSSIRSTQQENGDHDNILSSSPNEEIHKDLRKEISTLSEELMRQRSRLENSNTEVLTLRNRLRAALTRAEKAEKEATQVSINSSKVHDIERGNNAFGGAVRRRGGGGLRGRQKQNNTSISSMMKLDSGSGEQVGKVVDTIDAFATDTGYFFLNNPLPRAVFILYLVLLHLWAFCLVMFHAHWSLEPAETVGPAQLLKQQSYRHMEQAHHNEPQN